MRHLALVGLLAIGCGGKATAPTTTSNVAATPQAVDPDFDAYEKLWVADLQGQAARARSAGRTIEDSDIPTSYRHIYVGKRGVIVDRKLVATLAELDSKRAVIAAAVAANAKLPPVFGLTPRVTFDIDGESELVAVSALRAFAGIGLSYYARSAPDELGHPETSLCSMLALRDKPIPQDEEHATVQISVLLHSGEIWVGLSRVNEFQQIPDRSGKRDLEKLETTLKEHKASAFFVDRTDIEIGVKGNASSSGTAGDVLQTIGIACKVGWGDIVLLPYNQMAAIPEL